MAKADYILCSVCTRKVVYDGDDAILEALERLGLESLPIFCEEHRAGKYPAWVDFARAAWTDKL